MKNGKVHNRQVRYYVKLLDIGRPVGKLMFMVKIDVVVVRATIKSYNFYFHVLNKVRQSM